MAGGNATPEPAALGGTSIRLRATPPFDWRAMIGFFAARAIPGVEVVDGAVYRRSIEIDGAVGTVEVAAASPAKLDARIDVRGDWPAAEVEARLRRWFDVNADIGAIGQHLARDPRLAPLVAARRGLRVPGTWDPWELAVRAIVGQEISVAGARTIAGRLVARYGDRLPDGRGEVVGLFPRPEQLAAADMSTIGMPGARARSIVGLAAAVVDDLSLLDSSPDLDAVVDRLRALPGIGEWTAQYIALRGLKHPDAFPASDLGLLRAMARPDGRRPSPTELLARSEAWRPYRAYAAQHLWSADSTPATATD